MTTLSNHPPSSGLVERLLDRLFRRQDIGRRGDPLFVRWFVTPRAWRWRVMLHKFVRSDPEDLHDHPFNFVALILAGGYWERTPGGRYWRCPLTLLSRPAEWRHRVELRGRPSWSLVLAAPKRREWGFFCAGLGRWVHWREYDAREEAGLSGCGEA